jgi:hypothetical protein
MRPMGSRETTLSRDDEDIGSAQPPRAGEMRCAVEGGGPLSLVFSQTRTKETTCFSTFFKHVLPHF